MAKPYREGMHWSFRLRIKGEDIYRTGYATQALANEAQTEIRFALRQKGQPAAAGPFRTTLGQAFMNYARERLPKLKGANVDAVRINRYLRAVGLPIIRLKRLERPMNGTSIYWEVRFEAETTSRTPNSLKAHQAKLAKNSSQSLLIRQRLAGMTMSDVMTYHIQEFIDAMVIEGKGAATIDHERAELRRLFSHAIHIWRWRSIETNPASNLNMPAVNNKRDRVLSNDEWRKMLKALAESKNRYAVPLICLMLETSMRSCEPLTEARWGNVNWTRRILELPDSKGGKRSVPLNPGAMQILKELASKAGDYATDTPIFPTTYEAIKLVWAKARIKAGVHGVNLHDLRHTAATRYALEYKGNLPVIMQITGHKTVEMAMRYINIKVDDVVQMMHGKELDIGSAPAGYKRSLRDETPPPDVEATPQASTHQDRGLMPPVSNVIRPNFGTRAA